MFKIEDDTIYITRGDKGVFELSVTGYSFKEGDEIEFRVYKRRCLHEKPVLEKIIKVNADAEAVDIVLTPEETKIGELINKSAEYWYEIELNDEQTIIGFDEDGAKKLILYPEGAETDDTN